MGAAQTSVSFSRISETETERKPWFLRRMYYKKKKKKVLEVDDDISKEHEEITEEFKCKNYIKYKKVETKIIKTKSQKCIKNWDLSPTDKYENKKNVLGHTNEKSVVKHPELDDGYYTMAIDSKNICYDDLVNDSLCKSLTAKNSTDHVNSSFSNHVSESDTGFKSVRHFNKVLSKKNEVLKNGLIQNLHSCDNKFDVSDQTTATKEQASTETLQVQKEKNNVFSLLDERLSSFDNSCSTEMKYLCRLPKTESFEHQTVDFLKLEGVSCNSNDLVDINKKQSLQEFHSLSNLKAVSDTDEDNSDCFLMESKELSSSYPDTTVYSDSRQTYNLFSDEYLSVSVDKSKRYRSERCRTDSCTVLQWVGPSDNMSETLAKQLVISQASNIKHADSDCEMQDTNVTGFKQEGSLNRAVKVESADEFISLHVSDSKIECRSNGDYKNHSHDSDHTTIETHNDTHEKLNERTENAIKYKMEENFETTSCSSTPEHKVKSFQKDQNAVDVFISIDCLVNGEPFIGSSTPLKASLILEGDDCEFSEEQGAVMNECRQPSNELLEFDSNENTGEYSFLPIFCSLEEDDKSNRTESAMFCKLRNESTNLQMFPTLPKFSIILEITDDEGLHGNETTNTEFLGAESSFESGKLPETAFAGKRGLEVPANVCINSNQIQIEKETFGKDTVFQTELQNDPFQESNQAVQDEKQNEPSYHKLKTKILNITTPKFENINIPKKESNFLNFTNQNGAQKLKIGSTERIQKQVKIRNASFQENVFSASFSSRSILFSETFSKGRYTTQKKRHKGQCRSNSKYTKRFTQGNPRKRKRIKTNRFCSKCHQYRQKGNRNCSKCRLSHGELESGKFCLETRSEYDSGISSMLSVRSSVISEVESIQNLKKTTLLGSRRARKNVLKRFHKLGILNQELKKITSEFNIDSVAHVDQNYIVFPVLQSYFDSLKNGETPSLQERMIYEWLRLMSFSTYTGGGSPVHLARNGFYHAGSNATRCFSCNVSHSNWTYTDNVQEIHRRVSPNCALVNGEDESSGNISIESGDTQNHQINPAAESGGNSSSTAQAAAPATAGNHGEFSFGAAARSSAADPSTASSNPPVFRFPQNTPQQTSGNSVPNPVGPPTASAATAGGNSFIFGSFPSTQSSSEFRFRHSRVQQSGVADVAPQLTNQLQALTIQQSSGVQQPSDEPVSGNPVIAPTQPLQIARQADGDAQLTVSAHHQPESNEIELSTGNQRSAEASRSIDPEAENADNIQAQLNQVKHPNYTQMAVRMSSFSSWPNYLNQTPRQMAYAGFFHPGIADFARCFCCGGGLRNWEADDDPMVEHARWYPRCEYINRLKGTHFVQAVLRRHREHVAERQREREAIQNTYSSPDPMTTSVAANLLEMGFTEDRAREAILTVRRLRGRSEVSVEEVMTWMLDDDNSAGNQLPTNTASRNQTGLVLSEPGRAQPSSSSSSSSSETAVAAQHDSDSQTSIEEAQGPRSDSYASTGELEGATGGGQVKDERKQSKSRRDNSPAYGEKLKSTEGFSSEKSGKDTVVPGKKTRSDNNKSPAEPKSRKDKKTKRRKGQSPAPAEGAESMPPGSVDTKSLKEENKFLKQMQVCKICMDKYVSITFLPCGHLVCCEDCAKNMKKCPICRKRIKGQVRTFMS